MPDSPPRSPLRRVWTAAVGLVLAVGGSVLLEGELNTSRTGRPPRALAANALIVACGVGLLVAAAAGLGRAERHPGERAFDAGVGFFLLSACGFAALWRFPRLTPNVYAAAVVAVWAGFVAWALLYLWSAFRKT